MYIMKDANMVISYMHNKISIEHLNAGIYLIRVLDNAGRVSKSKFVKL